MNAHEMSMRVMELLGRLRESALSAEDQELLAIAIDAILFITSTGQRYVFVDYLRQSQSDEPPPVVAAFDTYDEAEAWLKNHPSPPDSAHVLIADQHYHVVYSREMDLRRLVQAPAIESYVEYLLRGGRVQMVAEFKSRGEALAWFEGQTESLTHAFVRIDGRDHLAVHYRNLCRSAIYEVSLTGKPGSEG